MARLAFDLSLLRVILIEDDTFSRELERTALQEIGVTAITNANNADEALDALDRGAPCDLILSDWNMPMFDGETLVSTLRGRWPGISILMLTNNEAIDQITMAFDAGVDGCLIRPFSLDKLREAIQLALISKLTGGRSVMAAVPAKRSDNPELAKVAASLHEVINAKGEAPGDSAEEWRGTGHLAARLSDQLNGFMGSLETIDSQQLEVIRLHVDCMQAVLSGRPALLAHETQNLIVDGLNFAADLVSGRAGDKS